ncbi:hypothetical protein [Actinocorallia populi]|uniref:hypothetical protein n=1 Tax=Actinocorallia populi TaxID=2079200 RepID=UPI000D0871B0|nr:hypothetical protein [Actinocorallia populi]
MKKTLGLALSGVMALSLTAATGAPAQASETSARQQQENARQQERQQQKAYRWRVRTKVRPYSWNGRSGGAEVLVYRYSDWGRRAPLSYARACLQQRSGWGGDYYTIGCKRTNRWGRVNFRFYGDDFWGRADRLRGQRLTSKRNWGQWYRVYVPPTYRTYSHYSRPFRLWDRDDWQGRYGDYDDEYDRYDDDRYDYGDGWRRTSANR